MPLVYLFAASKMEAQPVLVLASRNGTFRPGLIIERTDERFALIITGMGTRNAEAKADATLGLAALRERTAVRLWWELVLAVDAAGDLA
jgi:hypothetical protein